MEGDCGIGGIGNSFMNEKEGKGGVRESVDGDWRLGD